MARDLTVVLPDRPGALAELAEAFAEAGIGLLSACGYRARPGETWGILHVLVEDGDAAIKVAEEAGFQISASQEVLLIDVEDRLGALAEIARKLSDDGTNVDLLYLTPRMQLVVGTDDLKEGREGVKTVDARYP
ncbi:MAG TPA: amino acid-binding protein [Actinomycetota bacterium]|nr:amino acid-binding protein [Actinomycetota bacterium]